jgi:predicted permease
VSGRWQRQIRSLWRALARGRQLEADMRDEMRFHIEEESARLMRDEHLSPEEARRQAHIRFGGLERYKEDARDARALPWVDAISLDARLASRMLLKYRWLTLVGGFAMAVAIAIGASFYEVMSELTNPALPLPDGARVVALRFATDIPGTAERHVLHDFVALRDELTSIRDLGAFRTVTLNLVAPNVPTEPVKAAEISASAFAVARTAPRLGRYLLPSDELPSAPPVMVIGFRTWRLRFGGDPEIIGRHVTIGGTSTAIVGVMPGGFTFPVDHQFWIPFRENPLDYKMLEGPELYLFGKLAPNVSLAQARAELATIGQRMAADHPDTHARLRPLVNPYTLEFSGVVSLSRLWIVRIAELLISGLALIVAVNLAILIYARTVARMGEIAIRTALGASRRRILSQLFMESFALALVGAAVGLGIAAAALTRVHFFVFIGGGLPFWTPYMLSTGTAIYALLIATAAAFVMGVVPGLKATGRRVSANLHELNGRTGKRLGPMWTTLVVAQIVVAVAVLPAAVYLSWLAVRMEVVGAGFDTSKYVVSVVAMSDDGSAVEPTRARARQTDLMSRLAAEPGVTAVTLSSGAPGFGPGDRMVTLDDGREPIEISYLDVALDLFDVYDATLVAGRTFAASDLGTGVIVNETFARKFAGEYSTPADVIGKQFQYAGKTAWHQIVGVVHDFPAFPPSITLDGEPVIYHALQPGDLPTVVITTKYAGTIPDGLTERFRAVAAGVDPALQLRRVSPLSEYYANVRSIWRNLAWGIGLVTTSVLLLSAAGIYALMSLTVAQRTREIGIRTALGAEPRRLILSIFGRSLGQIGLGLLIGSTLSAAVCAAMSFTMAQSTALVGTVAIIMLIVGLLSALGPARRILRIQATDALRADA